MVMLNDDNKRIVYGAQCFWWDSIDKCGHLNTIIGLPCCPHCKGLLFEAGSEADWWQGADDFAADPKNFFSDYRQFIEWSRGKCFPTFSEAKEKWYCERLLESSKKG